MSAPRRARIGRSVLLARSPSFCARRRDREVCERDERHESGKVPFVLFPPFRDLCGPSCPSLFTLPPFSPSPDGSRTIFERSGDGRVLYWNESGLSLQKIAGRGDQPAVLLAGQDTRSLTLEPVKEMGERSRANQTQTS
jgi:hypothetical protein